MLQRNVTDRATFEFAPRLSGEWSEVQGAPTIVIDGVLYDGSFATAELERALQP